MIEKLKNWWWLIVVVIGFCGGLVAFGDSIQTYKKLPEQVKETSGSVEELSDKINEFIAAQVQVNENHDRLVSLLTTSIIDKRIEHERSND